MVRGGEWGGGKVSCPGKLSSCWKTSPRPLFISKRLVYKQPSESKQVSFTNNLTENQYIKQPEQLFKKKPYT